MNSVLVVFVKLQKSEYLGKGRELNFKLLFQTLK